MPENPANAAPRPFFPFMPVPPCAPAACRAKSSRSPSMYSPISSFESPSALGSTATTRPRYMTAMVSAMPRISSRFDEISSTPAPPARASRIFP